MLLYAKAGPEAPASSTLLRRNSAALAHCLWHSRPRMPVRVSAAAQVKPLSAEAAAAAAELEGWKQSRTLLDQRLGLSPETADSVLSDAFGWGSQSYWRQQKVQEPPSERQVQQVLDLLGGLGISDAELSKVVQSFPQVLGCEVSLLEGNLGTLRTKWFLKGRTLANTVVRKPQVLGSTVDCEGNCISECNRCWARF